MSGNPPPTAENATMFQAFEWYVPYEGHLHWQRLTDAIPKLRAIGISNMWIPPACKGANQDQGNGYDPYDLYDLGEFDQRGNGAQTKWGTKAELLLLRDTATANGIGLYFDAVLNHKVGADHNERATVEEVNPDNRLQAVSGRYEIGCQVGFDFPGRGEMYSSQKYHWYHFTGVDLNTDNNRTAIYRIVGEGKYWNWHVSVEKGNYDYLFASDLDYNHAEVQNDVKNWGVWVANELKLKGFRFDAVKHFSEDFLKDFIFHLDTNVPQDWLHVGEYWGNSLTDITDYLARLNHRFTLFDSPLVYSFAQISNSVNGDLSHIFDNTLVQARPTSAITLVQNHDTQPGQALESGAAVTDYFKPLAYALILLRKDGYPCVFYGDLYGIYGDGNSNSSPAFPPSCSGALPDLILARKLYAYGQQDEYFDFRTCVGWVRHGTWDRPSGCAVVMSNSDAGYKRMAVGIEHKGELWSDVLGWSQGVVRIGDDGFGTFACGKCSVSVWVNQAAVGRDLFGKFDAKIYPVNPWGNRT